MITSNNYFSSENALKYMSVSQFKMFKECEAKALAEIGGEYKRESSTALLVGSYVDSWFEGTLEQFKEHNPEIFLKNGGLKADYLQAEQIIERVKTDEMFMKYMGGEKQVIFTGTIENVPFKGKLDSYHADKCIVDLKVMRDFEPIWKDGRKRSFIEAWGYDIQGAVYQELVFQATGKKLPFFICAVTKEKTPDMAIISIPQERLDYCLETVKQLAPHFQDVKNGNIEPARCEKCDYCKSTKKIDSIIDYHDMNPDLFKERDTEPLQSVSEPVSIASIVSPVQVENAHTEPQHKRERVTVKKQNKSGKNITINLNF